MNASLAPFSYIHKAWGRAKYACLPRDLHDASVVGVTYVFEQDNSDVRSHNYVVARNTRLRWSAHNPQPEMLVMDIICSSV